MDRPFKELHEIYRLAFLKAEKQAKDDKEKNEKEEKERKKHEEELRSRGIGRPNNPMYNKPTDVTPTDQMDTLSPAAAEALQDALEDIM